MANETGRGESAAPYASCVTPRTHPALSHLRRSVATLLRGICPSTFSATASAPIVHGNPMTPCYQTVFTGYCGMTLSHVTIAISSVCACAMIRRSNGSP